MDLRDFFPGGAYTNFLSRQIPLTPEIQEKSRISGAKFLYIEK